MRSRSPTAPGWGAGVAVELLHTDTSAYVGNNSGDAPKLAHPVAGLAQGQINATSLTVQAQTLGVADAFAVAGAAAVSSADAASPNNDAGDTSSATGDVSSADGAAAGSVASGFTSASGDVGAGTAAPAAPAFGLAVSGAASAISSALATNASIDQGSVAFHSPGAVPLQLQVEALNNTFLRSGAGAGALSMAANPAATGFKAGIGGAVAYYLGANTTTATIAGSQVTNARSAAVRALSSGQQVAVAVDVAVSASALPSPSGALGASISIGTVKDGTVARIEDSSLDGGAAGDGSLDLVGYDKVDVGIGGGSLVGGGQAGVSAAITIATIGNGKDATGASVDAAGARILGSTVTNYGNVGVTALNPSRIAAGAASAGGGTSSNGLAGAFVFDTNIARTVAKIDADAASRAASLSGLGSLIVNADSVDNQTYDGLLSAALGANNPGKKTGIDFTGAAVGGSVGAGGVMAVAGIVQAGANNVGVSYVQSTVSEGHLASIGAATVVAKGAVTVSAGSSDTFLDLGLGVAVATGGAVSAFAGIGSGAAAIVDNTTTATIGGATISSASLNVTATDNSVLRTGAASLAISAALKSPATNGSAVGASIAYDQIGNTTQALVKGATLTTTGPVFLHASGTETITAGAAAGAGAIGNDQGVEVAGAVAINAIAGTIEAGLSGSSLNAGAPAKALGALTVSATDQSTIAGGEGDGVGSFGGNSVGIGVGVAVNQVGNIIYAHIDGAGTINATDVAVAATSTPSISTMGFGVAISNGPLGGDGSIAVNLLSSNVTAEITKNTAVTAQNNVAVLASNTDTIEDIAGSVGASLKSVGIGLAVAVNQIGGATTAQIAHGATVTALAGTASDTLTVNDGTLAKPIDVSAIQSPSATPPSLKESTQTLTGVVVDATSLQAITLNSGSAGFSTKFAGGLNVGVSVLGGQTLAAIAGATVTAQDSGQIYVKASSHSFAGSFVLGLAGSGVGAGAASVDVVNFARQTYAQVDDSPVQAGGAVTVDAHSSQNLASIAIGAVGSGIAVAGSVAVNEFNADTEAHITGSTTRGGSVAVGADSTDAMNVLGGAAAIGTSGAGGITFVLTNDQDETIAYLGDPAGGSTAVRTDGNVAVEATATTILSDIAVSGAGAGGAGLAGMASVTNLNATTQAGLVNAAVAGATGASGPGAISVKAKRNATVNPWTGAIGGGGTLGFGAGVNLIFVQDTVLAEAIGSAVGRDAAADSVMISAMTNRNFAPITATAGIGLSTGIAGAYTGIYLGTGAADDSLTAFDSSLGGTLSSVNSAAATAAVPATGGVIGVSTRSSLNRQVATSFSLTASQGRATLTSYHNPTNDGAAALVVGSLLNAATTVDVKATTDTSTTSITGAGAAGVNAGVGAGVALTRIYTTVAAQIDAGSSVSSGAGVTVAATAEDGSNGPAADALAFFGSGGLVALGGAGADAKISDTVTAEVGGAAGVGGVGGAGALKITATDTSTVTTATADAQIGAGAAGAAVSLATKNSTVTALATGLGFIGSAAATPSAITINATAGGAVTARATGAAGGVVAGTGAQANATDSSTITAELDRTSARAISAPAGGVTVSAAATPEVYAISVGAAVGLSVAIGVSLADAEARPTVTATVGNSTSLSGPGSLTVKAATHLPGDGHAAAGAAAVSASGGFLGGGTGADATAHTAASVTASLGTHVGLPDGDVAVKADENSQQTATATGIAAGAISAGGVTTHALADTATTATIGAGATSSATRSGALTIDATGTDEDATTTTAGSGGIGGGSAAATFTGNTTDGSGPGTSTATAQLLDAGNANQAALQAGSVSITATQGTIFQPSADSSQAAVVGGSGTEATNTVNSSAVVLVGQSTPTATATLAVTAPSITLAAVDTVLEPDIGKNLVVGSGGAINGASGTSASTVTQNAGVTVGAGVSLTVTGDFLSHPGVLSIAASDQLATIDLVKFSTGAALDVASAQSTLAATLSDTITIGAGAQLTSAGAIDIGSFITADVSATSAVSTYGAAGVAGGAATAGVAGSQTIAIGRQATLTALGDITVSAGQSGDGSYANNFNVSADSEVYNDTLVPVSTSPQGTATIGDQNTLTIAGGAKIDGAGNVSLGAYKGLEAATGTANAYYLYTGNTAVSGLGLGASTFSDSALVNFNGSAVAGLSHNVETLTIAANGKITAGSSDVTTTVDSAFNVQSFVQKQIDAIKAAAGSTPTDYQAGQLAALALLQSGVSSTPVTSVTVAPLWASGGTVTLHADTITGGGSVAAYGGPTITVASASADYLVLGKFIIPEQPDAGQILFTGDVTAAAAQQAGLGVSSNRAGIAPVISITSSHQPAAGDPAFPGSILLTGAVVSPSAFLEVSTALGSVGQFDTINAASVTLSAPSGNYSVTQTGYFSVGLQAVLEWRNAETVPTSTTYAAGALGSNGITSAANYDAITTAANLLYYSTYLKDKARDSTIGSFGAWLLGGTAYLFYGLDNGNFPASPIAGAPSVLTTVTVANATLEQTSSPAGVAAPAPITAKNIAIVANIIDVNGAINAGSTTTASIVLPATLAAQIQGDLAAFRASDAFNPSLAGSGGVDFRPVTGAIFPLSGVRVSNTGDQQIAASFNAQTGQIMIADTFVTGGGSVYLNGSIINSSATLGSINVGSGLGSVTVQNHTGYPVVLGAITNTSAAVSEVTIVDTLKSNGHGSPLATWYVFNAPGSPGAVALYDNTRDTSGSQTWTPGDWQTKGTANAHAALSYAPATNTAIESDETGTLARFFNVQSGIDYSSYTSTDLGAWSWLPLGAHAQPSPNSPHYAITYRLGSISAGVAYQETMTSTDPVYTAIDLTNSAGAVVSKKQVYTALHLTLQNLARADYPIAVNFTGGSGQVAVTSNASVVIGQAIANPAGTTSINATGSGATITATPAGSIDSTTTILQATAGIGSKSHPLAVAARAPGSLNALTASGNIYLTGLARLTTPIPVGQIWSGWDFDFSAPSATAVPQPVGTPGVVSLSAPSGLTAAPAGAPFYPLTAPGFIGEEIDLAAGTGGIGSASGHSDNLQIFPLSVAIVPATVSVGSASISLQGAVNATAAGGIYLSAPGDLPIGQIVSTGGDVNLNAGGDIFNSNELANSSLLRQNQLSAAIKILNLLANDGSETVKGYQNTVDAAYRAYWQIAALAFPNGQPYLSSGGQTPTFTAQSFDLSGHESVFAAQAAVALGVATPTNKQIDTYVKGQFDASKQILAAAFPNNAGITPQNTSFTRFDPKFDYVLSTSSGTYQQLVAGASWNQASLAARIDARAVQFLFPTSIYGEPVAVQGQNVSLTAQSGNIGSSAPPLTFELSSASPSPDAKQTAAILAAGPGAISIANEGNGQSRWTIRRQNFMNVQASGALTATAGGGDVYVSSGGNLNIGLLTGTNFRLKAGGNIVNARGPGLTNVAGGASATLQMESGKGGDIGTSDVPFQVGVGTLVLAQTGGSIWLAAAGTLNVGEVTAGQTVKLTAGRILSAFSNDKDQTAHVIGDKGLTLQSQGDIGSSTVPLEASAPDLTVSSPGQVYINLFGPYTAHTGSIPSGSLHLAKIVQGQLGDTLGGSIPSGSIRGGSVLSSSVLNTPPLTLTLTSGAKGTGAAAVVAGATSPVNYFMGDDLVAIDSDDRVDE